MPCIEVSLSKIDEDASLSRQIWNWQDNGSEDHWLDRTNKEHFQALPTDVTREGRFRPPARDFNIMAISTGRDCASASRHAGTRRASVERCDRVGLSLLNFRPDQILPQYFDLGGQTYLCERQRIRILGRQLGMI
jgi:hypothetical protein